MSGSLPKVERNKVAVIGLGANGVATVKNLLELGCFNVTGFERNEDVGGLWDYKPDPNQTSVLRTTRANGSKQFSVYQDHPFPDDVDNYPTAKEVTQYMRSYAKAFDLYPHFKLGSTITRISLASNPGSPDQWLVSYSEADKGMEGKAELFDRVIVTTGAFSKPRMPHLKGQELFNGKVLHCQAYKDPEPFKGKRVVVVGMQNTALDIATDVLAVAERVYLSHRGGGRVIGRPEVPIDHKITRRRFLSATWMLKHFPTFSSWLSSFVLDRRFRQEWPEMKHEWGLMPTPPLANAPGAVNDHAIRLMSEGKIINLAGIQRFTESGIIVRRGWGRKGDTDGEEEIPCDAVIFATGYMFDYSYLAPEADPTTYPTPEWDAGKHTEGLPYPRLWRTLMHPDHLDSLAFIGPYRGISFAAFGNADLSAQAIAQLWSGRYPMPSKSEVDRWCAENYQFSLNQIKPHRVPKVGTYPAEFERWVNEVAGNQMNEKLGWGWEGWKFWWNNRRLCGLLNDGIHSPAMYRLFDGRPGSRLKWDKAEAEIWKVNGQSPPSR